MKAKELTEDLVNSCPRLLIWSSSSEKCHSALDLRIDFVKSWCATRSVIRAGLERIVKFAIRQLTNGPLPLYLYSRFFLHTLCCYPGAYVIKISFAPNSYWKPHPMNKVTIEQFALLLTNFLCCSLSFYEWWTPPLFLYILLEKI